VSSKKIDSYEKYLKKLRKRNFRRPKYDLDGQINTTINKFKEGQIFQENYTEKDILDVKLKMFKIEKYKINDDLSVDVYGPVHISHTEMSKLPIQFNNIYGDFHISWNKLRTLEFKRITKYFI
jgi:hypothetical protein